MLEKMFAGAFTLLFMLLLIVGVAWFIATYPVLTLIFILGLTALALIYLQDRS
jgi:hypothetical protein